MCAEASNIDFNLDEDEQKWTDILKVDAVTLSPFLVWYGNGYI